MTKYVLFTYNMYTYVKQSFYPQRKYVPYVVADLLLMTSISKEFLLILMSYNTSPPVDNIR